jgi:hypothetical protein
MPPDRGRGNAWRRNPEGCTAERRDHAADRPVVGPGEDRSAFRLRCQALPRIAAGVFAAV